MLLIIYFLFFSRFLFQNLHGSFHHNHWRKFTASGFDTCGRWMLDKRQLFLVIYEICLQLPQCGGCNDDDVDDEWMSNEWKIDVICFRCCLRYFFSLDLSFTTAPATPTASLKRCNVCNLWIQTRKRTTSSRNTNKIFNKQSNHFHWTCNKGAFIFSSM